MKGWKKSKYVAAKGCMRVVTAVKLPLPGYDKIVFCAVLMSMMFCQPDSINALVV